jgi:hypothetical protein
MGLANFLPRLASNYDPPNVCCPSNWDYTCESLDLAPVGSLILKSAHCFHGASLVLIKIHTEGCL